MLLIKLSGTLEPMPTVYTTGSTAGAAAPAASGDGACPASNSAVRTRVPKPWRSLILALLIRFYRSCGVGRYCASGGDFTGDIQPSLFPHDEVHDHQGNVRGGPKPGCPPCDAVNAEVRDRPKEPGCVVAKAVRRDVDHDMHQPAEHLEDDAACHGRG